MGTIVRMRQSNADALSNKSAPTVKKNQASTEHSQTASEFKTCSGTDVIHSFLAHSLAVSTNATISTIAASTANTATSARLAQKTVRDTRGDASEARKAKVKEQRTAARAAMRRRMELTRGQPPARLKVKIFAMSLSAAVTTRGGTSETGVKKGRRAGTE